MRRERDSLPRLKTENPVLPRRESMIRRKHSNFAGGIAVASLLGLAGCNLSERAAQTVSSPEKEPSLPSLAKAASTTTSKIKYVFVIAMENTNASSIYGNTTSAP